MQDDIQPIIISLNYDSENEQYYENEEFTISSQHRNYLKIVFLVLKYSKSFYLSIS